MLAYLTIDNLALIDRLEIELNQGLNILTGETGAGKSIVFDAISLILGGRGQKDLIRNGAKKLAVEAVFQFTPDTPVMATLKALEVPDIESGELIIRREMTASSNRCKVNGETIPTMKLAAIGDALVDFHGQHEHQSLLQASFHRECLDTYGHLEPLAQKVAAAHSRLQEATKELVALRQKQGERDRLLDMLRFQVDEIAQANLVPGEDEALDEEFRRLHNADTIAQNVSGVVEGLAAAEEAVIGQLGRCRSLLAQVARHDSRLPEQVEALEAARLDIEGVVETLEDMLQEVESDPGRLEQVILRQETLKRLKRKYGATVDEVLAFAENAAKELDDLENAEHRFEGLEAEVAAAKEELLSHAQELSRQRKTVATELEDLITSELQDLALKRSFVKVVVEEREECGPHGLDQVEFLFAPNPGNPPKPLRKIASGGEMSRVMLAIKGILAEADTIPVLVFDEIDTGIGGDVGNALGARLAALGSQRQVICVTHLPQIARFANKHFFVEKGEQDGVVATNVRTLEDQERVDELARMLSGKVTDQARRHAEELLVGRG